MDILHASKESCFHYRYFIVNLYSKILNKLVYRVQSYAYSLLVIFILTNFNILYSILCKKTNVNTFTLLKCIYPVEGFMNNNNNNNNRYFNH